MTETAEFTMGSEVLCSDGPCGELRRLVIDPAAGTLTHLVVEPKHARAGGRLVPLGLVIESTAECIRLRCTISNYGTLEQAEETQLLPETSASWGQEPPEPLFYGLGMKTLVGIGPQTIRYDRVPLGEVELRSGQQVHAKDGPIGRVHGLVIDPDDNHVTHFLLDEGHLWGQKRVAIPMSAVEGIEGGVRLNLTKDEVRDLPPVELDR